MPARRSIAGPSALPSPAQDAAQPHAESQADSQSSSPTASTSRRPRRSRTVPKRIYEDTFLSGAANLDDEEVELIKGKGKRAVHAPQDDESDSEDEWRPEKGKGKGKGGQRGQAMDDDDDEDAEMGDATEQDEDELADEDDDDEEEEEEAPSTSKRGRKSKPGKPRSTLRDLLETTTVKAASAKASWSTPGTGVHGKGTRPLTKPDPKMTLGKRDLEGFWRPPQQWSIVRSRWPHRDEEPKFVQTTHQEVRAATSRARRRHLPWMDELHDHAWWPGRAFSVAEERERALEWIGADEIKRAIISERAGAPFDVETSFKVLDDHSLYTSPPAEDDYQALHADMPDVSEAIAGLTTGGDGQEEADVKFVNLVELPPNKDGERIKLMAGPVDDEVELRIGKGETVDMNSIYNDKRHSHVGYAGGHIYSLDWRPLPLHALIGKEYLAVSASSARHPRTSIGSRASRPSPAALQIWSAGAASEQGGSMEVRLEMYACHELGSAWEISWCPTGHDQRVEPTQPDQGPRRLGLLAGVFQTGVLAVFSIPHPDDARREEEGGTVSVFLEPIVELNLYGTALPQRLAWAGGERLAVGCSNGFIAIWNMRQILSSGGGSDSDHGKRIPSPPTHFFPTQGSPITSLTWQMHPRRDTTMEDLPPNAFLHEEAPNTLIYSNMAGEVGYLDVDEPGIQETMSHTRYPCLATSFSPYTGFFLSDRDENATRTISNRPETWGGKTLISRHMGLVTTIDCSPHHLWIAAGAQDGAVRITDLAFGAMKRQTKASTPLYRLDISRSTGVLRMLDNLLPCALTEEDVKGAPTTWHPSLCITDVSWSPNASSRALLIASASASGLLRVDWCDAGVSAVGVREGEVKMEVDEDELED